MDCVQTAVEYLRGRRLHNLTGQSVPVLSHSHSEVVTRVQLEFPVHQFLPIVSCPVACPEVSGPILLALSLQMLTDIDKFLLQLSLLKAEQAQLPQPVLKSEGALPQMH